MYNCLVKLYYNCTMYLYNPIVAIHREISITILTVQAFQEKYPILMLYRSGLQDYFLIQSQANDRFTNAFWQTHSSLLYCFLLLVSSGSNPLSGKYYCTSLSALSEQFDILRRHSTHFRVTITTIITSNDNRAQAHISTRCRLRLFFIKS